MKRYYHPNTTIKHKGKKIEITSNGTCYQRTNKGNRKLDSQWFPKKMVLAICLLSDETIEVRRGNDGKLEVINKEGE